MTSKLTIRSKLAAALAVPLIALAALVAVQVRDSVGNTEQRARASRPRDLRHRPRRHRHRHAERAQLRGRCAASASRQAVDLPVKTPEGSRAARPTARSTDVPQQPRRPRPEGGRRVPAGALGHRRRHRRPANDRGHARADAVAASRPRAASDLFGNYTTLLGELLDANQQGLRTRSTTHSCAPVSSC